MQTRRSPRNQERLWRALAPPAPPRPEQAPRAAVCFNCRSYPAHGRSRATCRIGGATTGMTAGRACFTEER